MAYINRTIYKPKVKKWYSTNRKERQQIYQNSKWKELRHSRLLHYPICEICKERGIITPSEDVHHRDSFANYRGNDRLAKAYDYDNLIALCKDCHAFLHRKGTTHHLDIPTTIMLMDAENFKQPSKEVSKLKK